MEWHRLLLVLLASSFTAPPTVAYNTLYGYTQAELAAFITGTVSNIIIYVKQSRAKNKL